ncbi:uncharacterized protein LOC128500685 [Spea bombifrons]|uniref:uncharacterized protein LOC128500685 n=1 Tax=Spea bombifrons TaxID=233779 RepID=UPI00234AB51D|nr:uncharacterized protein LOC128500685 [Spea bombifrons]
MDGALHKKEDSDIASSLEGEDFFCRLTDEEKECLQYLLETIDSLDADDDHDDDDDENANTEQGSSAHFSNSKDDCPEGKLDKNQRRLGESALVPDKAEPEPSLPKMKITKSFSEDGPGFSITVSPETGHRSAGSHPSHLRKFDTIMKSGVNVQELRARFIRQQVNFSPEDHSKGTELSGASKQQPQAALNPISARQEALQKLGLLNRNQSTPNATRNSSETRHETEQSSSVRNCEINQNTTKGLESPSPLPRKSKGLERTWPP